MTVIRKYTYMLTGVLVLFLLAYVFSFSKTWKLFQHVQELELEEQHLIAANDKLEQAKQTYKYLDSLLMGSYSAVTKPFEQLYLSELTQFANDHRLHIQSFGTPHKITQNQVNRLTYSIVLVGQFKDLLAAQKYIEHQQYGTLLHVSYGKTKNYNAKKELVTCEIFIQRITR